MATTENENNYADNGRASVDQENSTTKDLGLPEDGKNYGTGPAPFIPNGAPEGQATQPKEHTGNMTDMGGATGGTPGLPDASEGNDNSGGHL